MTPPLGRQHLWAPRAVRSALKRVRKTPIESDAVEEAQRCAFTRGCLSLAVSTDFCFGRCSDDFAERLIRVAGHIGARQSIDQVLEPHHFYLALGEILPGNSPLFDRLKGPISAAALAASARELDGTTVGLQGSIGRHLCERTVLDTLADGGDGRTLRLHRDRVSNGGIHSSLLE